MRQGVKEVEVRVRGAGSGRESAIRALAIRGLTISSIEDVTPLPHNGCRARKRAPRLRTPRTRTWVDTRTTSASCAAGKA
jgi:hypothetical protein